MFLSVLVGLSGLYWFVLGALALRSYFGVRTIASLSEPTRTSWPKLSVVIPARNEGAHVLEALKAKLSDGYPELQVVLVDDRSTDDTGAQARALNDPRLTVTRVDTLPEGWLGKVNAMHQGLQSANGEWILFSDADVHLAPGTLAKLIDWAEREGIDSIAAVPKITPGGPVITAALAAFSRFIVTFPRLWAVEDPKSKAAMGVGAFNLFRKSALEKSPGLEWLKMEIADDAALGIMLKRAGARQRVVIGQDSVSLEFYESYSAMARALEKNGAMAPFGLIVLGLVAITAIELGYLAAFADQSLVFAGLSTWVLGVITQLGVCRWLRMPSWPACFPGLGIVPLVTAIGRSGLLAWRRGGVNWRGTFYSTATVRAGMRIK